MIDKVFQQGSENTELGGMPYSSPLFRVGNKIRRIMVQTKEAGRGGEVKQGHTTRRENGR